MIHIVFIDEIRSSLGNGIGTYKSMMLSELRLQPEFKVTLLGVNAHVKSVTYKNHSNYSELLFPEINGGNWNDAGFAICAIARNYIEDNTHTIFMINHSPCDKFIPYLRDIYANAKVVCVIHDQGWCSTLFGSKSIMRDIIKDIPNSMLNNEIRIGIKTYYEKEKAAYEMADAIVCLSKSTHSVVNELYGIPQNKIALIPNIYKRVTNNIDIAKSDLRKKFKLSQKDKIVVYAGRLAEYKGIPSLLIAIAELQRLDIPIKLVICGSMAGIPKYESLIAPIATSVIFTGQLSFDAMRQWFAMSDIGILPSYSEQFGYAAIEMIDCGLPIVVSDGNGLCDLFNDGDTALVAHIDDVVDTKKYGKELALKIKEALNLTKSRKLKIISNGISLIEREFSAQNIIGKYIALFNNLILHI